MSDNYRFQYAALFVSIQLKPNSTCCTNTGLMYVILLPVLRHFLTCFHHLQHRTNSTVDNSQLLECHCKQESNIECLQVDHIVGPNEIMSDLACRKMRAVLYDSLKFAAFYGSQPPVKRVKRYCPGCVLAVPPYLTDN